MKKVEKFYSRFGEDVVGVVKARADKDGDIKPLLKQLGLPLSGVIDRQHRTLVEFIHHRGKGLFIKAVSLSGGAIAVRRLLEAADLASVTERRLRMQQAILTSESGSDINTNVREASGASAEAEYVDMPDQVLHEIDTPTYAGPNRRVRDDRRTRAADRRVDCQIIMFKNRRFGGRRRKIKRRAND